MLGLEGSAWKIVASKRDEEVSLFCAEQIDPMGRRGFDSSVNGQRFCRLKRPTALKRKWGEWQVIPTSSLVSKWREIRGSSTKATKYYGYLLRCLSRVNHVISSAHHALPLFTQLRTYRCVPLIDATGQERSLERVRKSVDAA